MKKLLILLFSLFFLSTTSVFAETVLYCHSELATGVVNINGTYQESSFEKYRFTAKFNSDFTQLEGATAAGGQPMECKVSFEHKPNLIFCVHSWGAHETFMYDKNKKRFLLTQVSSAGYAFDGGDTDVLYAGTCEKF